MSLRPLTDYELIIELERRKLKLPKQLTTRKIHDELDATVVRISKVVATELTYSTIPDVMKRVIIKKIDLTLANLIKGNACVKSIST